MPSSGVHVVASTPRGLESMANGNGNGSGSPYANGIHAVSGGEGGAHGNGGNSSPNGNGNGNGAAAAAADVVSASSSDWADIYSERFDMVLLADETFNVPLTILDFLLAPLPTSLAASDADTAAAATATTFSTSS